MDAGSKFRGRREGILDTNPINRIWLVRISVGNGGVISARFLQEVRFEGFCLVLGRMATRCIILKGFEYSRSVRKEAGGWTMIWYWSPKRMQSY